MSTVFRVRTRDELPSSLRMGARTRIAAQSIECGEEVTIGDDVTIVGDRVVLGAGVSIGDASDIRAGNIEIGAGSEIGRACNVLVAESFQVGPSSRVTYGAALTCRSFVAGPFLYLAQHFSVGYGGTTESHATVTIGRSVALGPHCILNANCPIVLEDDVGSGGYLSLWTHGFHFSHSVLDGFPPSFEPIIVRKNVWLGFHVTVLPGVEIGSDSIIAAGAVVAKSIPPSVLAGGVPCRVIREIRLEKLPRLAAEEAVVRILNRWCEELEWKGVPWKLADRADGELFHIQVSDSGLRTPVDVVFCRDEMVPAWAERTVVLYLAKAPERHVASILESATIFTLRSRSMQGRSCRISEDLRDHLRRNTLGCGQERVLSSIEPEPFRRLKEAELPHER